MKEDNIQQKSNNRILENLMNKRKKKIVRELNMRRGWIGPPTAYLNNNDSKSNDNDSDKS